MPMLSAGAVDRVTEKLRAFAEALPEDERVAFALLMVAPPLFDLRSGGDGGPEVVGHAMGPDQMSFNQLSLQLQSQMQHENRSYTAISNIMKTKHDTVKNSIGNVR